MNLNKIFFLIFFLCNFALAENQEPIRIGSILILSGQGASWGTSARNGIDLAVEKINADGGINGRRFVAIHQDDQGQAKNALSAFRQLTEVSKVKIIIGPCWSTLGIPLIDLADKNKVLMISPSLGMAKFNESSKYLFNTWPHDYILSEQLAEYVFRKGHRSIALVGAEDVWVKEQTAAFKARFEFLGGKISYIAEPLPSSSDLRTEALKIVHMSNIDAFVSTTDGIIVGSLVAKALKELQSKIPAYSITLDQSAIDAAQGGFEGLEYLTFLTPSLEFKETYQARFKTSIDIGADSAYDAVMLIAQAIRDTGSTDTEILAESIAKVKSYNGVSGRLVSDGKRGFTKPYSVVRVVLGKSVVQAQ